MKALMRLITGLNGSNFLNPMPPDTDRVAGHRFTSPMGRGRARSVRVRGNGASIETRQPLTQKPDPLTQKPDPLTPTLSPWERGRSCLGFAIALLAATIAPVIVSAQTPAQRIVTLGSDVTEIVHALGEGKRIVGRDTTSVYPEQVTTLPDVGYFRQLSAEGVLSLKPDLILAAKLAGPPESLKQIAGAGVTIVSMPESFTPDGLLRKVETIANALGVPEKGAALAAELKREADDAKALIAQMPGKPKVLFIIAAGGGAPMAAGTHTGADALVTLAGGENVFAAHTGYKTVSLEATVAAGPEVIAMMASTLENLGGVSAVTENPALKLTPAAKTKRIVARDGSYLLAFGPRLPQAMLDFARAIRGEEKK
jgi:iron complex transport system substrate-binding protein